MNSVTLVILIAVALHDISGSIESNFNDFDKMGSCSKRCYGNFTNSTIPTESTPESSTDSTDARPPVYTNKYNYRSNESNFNDLGKIIVSCFERCHRTKSIMTPTQLTPESSADPTAVGPTAYTNGYNKSKTSNGMEPRTTALIVLGTLSLFFGVTYTVSTLYSRFCKSTAYNVEP